MWENTVITNAGIELLKNALSGGTITVTAIKSGAGKVDVSALKSQTAVSSIKQSGTVQGVTKTDETIKIGVLFSNAGLSAGYSMTQLGIYAKGSTGSEVLFAISQNTTGKEVPSESAMPSWSLVHNFYIKLNNDVTMTATVDPEGYVTFETMQTALNTHTGNKSNPHSVTKSQVGLGNVPNVVTNDQTPTYSDTTTLVTLSSGEKISIAFAKIKLAITTLINHLANKSNPHGVTKSQVGLGNVENKSSATIRGELTKGNVTTALGFTPANQTDMTNAQDAITQLNSDIAGLQFDVIHLSGTTDEYGQIWVGAPNIKLEKVTYIECLTSTFSRSVAPYGIINLEAIENEGLKFRLIATNNSTFNNYPIDKNVVIAYKY